MHSWGDCITYYFNLKNGKPGALELAQSIDQVDFSDFARSWASVNQSGKKDQIDAVKEVLRKSQHLTLVWIRHRELKEEQFTALHVVFNGLQIDGLTIDNTKLAENCMVHISVICRVCKIKKLVLRECGLRLEHLREFAQQLDNVKIDMLDLSVNPLTADAKAHGLWRFTTSLLGKPQNGLLYLVFICERASVKRLILQSCNLDRSRFKEFLERAENTKITEMDISGNPRISTLEVESKWSRLEEFLGRDKTGDQSKTSIRLPISEESTDELSGDEETTDKTFFEVMSGRKVTEEAGEERMEETINYAITAGAVIGLDDAISIQQADHLRDVQAGEKLNSDDAISDTDDEQEGPIGAVGGNVDADAATEQGSQTCGVGKTVENRDGNVTAYLVKQARQINDVFTDERGGRLDVATNVDNKKEADRNDDVNKVGDDLNPNDATSDVFKEKAWRNDDESKVGDALNSDNATCDVIEKEAEQNDDVSKVGKDLDPDDATSDVFEKEAWQNDDVSKVDDGLDPDDATSDVFEKEAWQNDDVTKVCDVQNPGDATCGVYEKEAEQNNNVSKVGNDLDPDDVTSDVFEKEAWQNDDVTKVCDVQNPGDATCDVFEKKAEQNDDVSKVDDEVFEKETERNSSDVSKVGDDLNSDDATLVYFTEQTTNNDEAGRAGDSPGAAGTISIHVTGITSQADDTIKLDDDMNLNDVSLITNVVNAQASQCDDIGKADEKYNPGDVISDGVTEQLSLADDLTIAGENRDPDNSISDVFKKEADQIDDVGKPNTNLDPSNVISDAVTEEGGRIDDVNKSNNCLGPIPEVVTKKEGRIDDAGKSEKNPHPDGTMSDVSVKRASQSDDIGKISDSLGDAIPEIAGKQADRIYDVNKADKNLDPDDATSAKKLTNQADDVSKSNENLNPSNEATNVVMRDRVTERASKPTRPLSHTPKRSTSAAGWQRQLSTPASRKPPLLPKPILATKPAHRSLKSLPILNRSTDLEEIDATSIVQKLDVKKSTVFQYQDHLQSEDIYPIKQRKKGRVLIINNEFRGSPLKERRGSMVDVQNQEELWTRLGFHVNIKRDLNAADMITACKAFANDKEPTNVVVLIIMTHGGRGYLESEDGDSVPIPKIIHKFSSRKAPHLQDTPKVLIFQACRGPRLESEHDDEGLEIDATVENYHRPARRNMLLVYPCQSGTASVRHRETGSWLMNAISNVFSRKAHNTHVLDMLTEVNRIISDKTCSRGSQMSNQENYLTRRLFLYPGWPAP